MSQHYSSDDFALAEKHGLVSIYWKSVARCSHTDAKYLMDKYPQHIVWNNLLENSADWVFDLFDKGFASYLDSYREMNDEPDSDLLDIMDDGTVADMFAELFPELTMAELAGGQHAWVAKLVETYPVYFMLDVEIMAICMQNKSEPMIRVMDQIITGRGLNCDSQYSIATMAELTIKSVVSRFSSNQSPLAIALLNQYLVSHPDLIDWALLSANPAAIDILISNPSKVDIGSFIRARQLGRMCLNQEKLTELVTLLIERVHTMTFTKDADKTTVLDKLNNTLIVKSVKKKAVSKKPSTNV